MENLPLGRIAALVPEFAVKDLPLGRTQMMMMIIIIIIIINIIIIIIIIIIIRVFCPMASSSLQAQEPML